MVYAKKSQRQIDLESQLSSSEIIQQAKELFNQIESFTLDEKVELLNSLRSELHKHSPFQREPVDFVRWVPMSQLEANDYNPNVVAPPEMKLLEISIQEDGYTQPIVAWDTGEHYEVVDGFHRNRVGKESLLVNGRINGYLPIAVVQSDEVKRGNRIASTIRHNRARGKHHIQGMSDIVLELKGRNWTNEKIAKELGMDQDEILRLCQISGLAEAFKDQEFSKAWDIEGFEDDFTPLEDHPGIYEEEQENFRTVNTNDGGRIFHHYSKWECFKAGFYKTVMDGMTRKQCEQAYRDFLADPKWFADTLQKVITEWKHSCEHYLTNQGMNRIAWLGQAAMCYETGIPATFRGGFNLLTEKQQNEANEVALRYLNKWLTANGRGKVNMEEAMGQGRQMDLY